MQLGGPRKGLPPAQCPAFPIAATGDWRAALKAAGYRVSSAYDDNPSIIYLPRAREANRR